MKKNNQYALIGDELANKVKHLHNALSHAEDIVNKLQAENKRLNDLLSSLITDNTVNSNNRIICV